jgi:transposase
MSTTETTAKIRTLFEGEHPSRRPGDTFVALVLDRPGEGIEYGCDCYFDAGGNIVAIEDWQDGNGLIAHDVLTDARAAAMAKAAIINT